MADYFLFTGDSLAVLKTFASDSIDGLVTDPPYGLSDAASFDLPAILAGWLADGLTPDGSTGKGFMGRQWDHCVPPPALWREVLRVMKPGAYGAVFAGARTGWLMGTSLALAGFEIRDEINWLYGSGFPKSQNISIALDKAAGAMGHRGRDFSVAGTRRGVEGARVSLESGKAVAAHVPITPLAERWNGYGTALKPSREPIFIVRKPPVGTIPANVARYGTGGINTEGCRVGNEPVTTHTAKPHGGVPGEVFGAYAGRDVESDPRAGRWPANTILTHSPACVCVGTVTEREPVNPLVPETWEAPQKRTVDLYACVPGCPVRALDEQSGPTTKQKGGILRDRGAKSPAAPPMAGGDRLIPARPAAPGASAFFYVAKASRREREAGLAGWRDVDGTALTVHTGAEATDRVEGSAGLSSPRAGAGRTSAGVRNFHPTVKPVALIEYLVRLVSPPPAPDTPTMILEPFAGSGTTGVASIREGVFPVLIEAEPSYHALIRARCDTAVADDGGP